MREQSGRRALITEAMDTARQKSRRVRESLEAKETVEAVKEEKVKAAQARADKVTGIMYQCPMLRTTFLDRPPYRIIFNRIEKTLTFTILDPKIYSRPKRTYTFPFSLLQTMMIGATATYEHLSWDRLGYEKLFRIIRTVVAEYHPASCSTEPDVDSFEEIWKIAIVMSHTWVNVLMHDRAGDFFPFDGSVDSMKILTDLVDSLERIKATEQEEDYTALAPKIAAAWRKTLAEHPDPSELTDKLKTLACRYSCEGGHGSYEDLKDCFERKELYDFDFL